MPHSIWLMYVRSTLDFEDSTDWDQPRSRRYCLSTSPKWRLIRFLRTDEIGCTPPTVSSLQFFYGSVEKEVRSDIQAFSNCKQHRQRGLTARAFEQRGISAGNSTAEGEFFLGKVLSFPNLLENPPECHRCLAIACHGRNDAMYGTSALRTIVGNSHYFVRGIDAGTPVLPD